MNADRLNALAGDGLTVKTFSCYHHFFSQARWTIDTIGRVMLALVVKFISEDVPMVFMGRFVHAAVQPVDPALIPLGREGRTLA